MERGNKKRRTKAPPRKAQYFNRTGGLSDVELKYIDHYRVHTVPYTADAAGADEADPATALCLNAVGTGTGANTRDGRKIVMKSVYVEGICSMPISATGADYPQVVTIALVLDRQTNSAQCQSELVWQNDVAVSGPTASFRPLVRRNLEYVDRFHVLWKKTYVFRQPNFAVDTAGTGYTNGGDQIKFKIYRKLDIPVIFKDTGSTVSSIVDNSLHLHVFSDDNVGLVYSSRVRFVG